MQFLTAIDPLYALSGLVVGILVGITGIGGGSLMTPLLILFFGVQPATAVGTDLLFAALTKTVGTAVHGAARTIEWSLVGLLAAGSLPGTVATLIFLSMFDLGGAQASRILTLALGCVLLLTAVFLICARKVRIRYASGISAIEPRKVRLFTVLLGLAMGILVSSTSVGAGAIGVTVLLLLHSRMPVARIVGSDIAHAVPLTLAAGTGHWFLGSVDWGLLGMLLIGSVPGIVIGSYMASQASDGVVRSVLALMLIAVSIRLLT